MKIKLLTDIKVLDSVVLKKGDIVNANKKIMGSSYVYSVGEKTKINVFKNEAIKIDNGVD